MPRSPGNGHTATVTAMSTFDYANAGQKLSPPDSRSLSPEAPPWSPITPALEPVRLPTDDRRRDHQSGAASPPSPSPGLRRHEPTRSKHRSTGSAVSHQSEDFVPESGRFLSRAPHPVPISEDTSPDAIALRAALDVLQIQRLKAIQDIQTLQSQKEKALMDTKGFLDALSSGLVYQSGSRNNQALGSAVNPPETRSAESPGSKDANMAVSEEYDAGKAFMMPGPQDVVRCPPINWHKYHVDGRAFEAVAEAQTRRPASLASPVATGMQKEGNGGVGGGDYILAGPYRPFADDLQGD